MKYSDKNWSFLGDLANKAYYTEPSVILFRGDCLEIIKEIPTGVVDLVLTDPPYMISNEVTITRGRNKMKFKGGDISHHFGDWDKFNSFEEYMSWCYQWVDETARIIRDGGMLCSYFDRDKVNFISRYLQTKHLFKLKGYYADLKSNPVPQARKVTWMSGWEIIGLWQKSGGKLTFNYQLGQEKDWGVRAIVNKSSDGLRCHPTQKPISVMVKFISYWSSIHDVVCDPFLGSGTTAVASKKLNRKFIGIEKEEKYLKLTIERLRQDILPF